MDVRDAIEKRRAYRSLDPVPITDGMLSEVIESVRSTPSCFNQQPWRYVFVRDPIVLEELFTALGRGNEWATAASMIVAVFSGKDDDCVIKDREYHLFDTGMATAFMILRLTEMGLVAHPIAGFSQTLVREVLSIPEGATVITLLIVGKHSTDVSPLLSGKQIEAERDRPERLAPEEFTFRDRYSG